MAFTPFDPQNETTLLKDRFHWTPDEMSLKALLGYIYADLEEVDRKDRDHVRTIVFNPDSANAMPDNYAGAIKRSFGLTVKVDDTLGPTEFRFGY